MCAIVREMNILNFFSSYMLLLIYIFSRAYPVRICSSIYRPVYEPDLRERPRTQSDYTQIYTEIKQNEKKTCPID